MNFNLAALPGQPNGCIEGPSPNMAEITGSLGVMAATDDLWDHLFCPPGRIASIKLQGGTDIQRAQAFSKLLAMGVLQSKCSQSRRLAEGVLSIAPALDSPSVPIKGE
ncbi:MAG: hypothetical protein R3F45_14745 [Gammaproteobacteria bacterium]